MIEDILALSFSFLSFLIVYGILNKIRVFERSINLIIALVSSFFVIGSFYYYKTFILAFFSFSALLVFIVFIILSFYFLKKI